MVTKDNSHCYYRYLCVVSMKYLNNTFQMQTAGLNQAWLDVLVSMVTTYFLQLCLVTMKQ